MHSVTTMSQTLGIHYNTTDISIGNKTDLLTNVVRVDTYKLFVVSNRKANRDIVCFPDPQIHLGCIQLDKHAFISFPFLLNKARI